MDSASRDLVPGPSHSAPIRPTRRTAAALQPRYSRNRIECAGPADVGTSEGASIRSRRASPMSRRRRFGSFVRQRRRSRRIDGGVAAGSAVQSGSRSRSLAIVSDTVAARNGERAVSISNSTHPNAQMSVRSSTIWPRACSGLMYAAVPRSYPRESWRWWPWATRFLLPRQPPPIRNRGPSPRRRS